MGRRKKKKGEKRKKGREVLYKNYHKDNNQTVKRPETLNLKQILCKISEMLQLTERPQAKAFIPNKGMNLCRGPKLLRKEWLI